jgi:predicted DNA-binding transcriptional regulator AlpA
MSSEPPYPSPGHTTRAELLTHTPELKSFSKEVSQAKNASPTSRIRSGPSIDVLLTPKEAAHSLRVSPSWLAKARMRGDGPAYVKVGRSVRYTESALIQWMKSQRRLSTSEQ